MYHNLGPDTPLSPAQLKPVTEIFSVSSPEAQDWPSKKP